MRRRRITSASPYEAEIGFCRAMRVGDRILVAGTGPVEPDGSSTPGDVGAQADRCFAIIRAAIEELGGTMSEVVRTRMFLTDIADMGLVSAAHARAVGEARPVATMLAVAALARPEWKVEIAAEAVLGAD